MRKDGDSSFTPDERWHSLKWCLWCVTRENTILFSRWNSATKLWQLSVQIISDCS